MERIGRIHTGQIRMNPSDPLNPWSIHPIRTRSTQIQDSTYNNGLLTLEWHSGAVTRSPPECAFRVDLAVWPTDPIETSVPLGARFYEIG